MANSLSKLEPILANLAYYPEKLGRIREIVLANAVMCGEIPSPTFHEDKLIQFLRDRFIENDLDSISIDEAGNGSAIMPGRQGDRNILVSAHADTLWQSGVDHSVMVGSDRLVGPGVADNSFGIAVIASLPQILQALEIELDANLILLGSTKSLGRGDIGGMRFFVENSKYPIHAGVCVEGVHLGRLSYACLAMFRGEITVAVPEETNWERRAATGAVISMNRIISQMLAIKTPRSPATSIILGSIMAGSGYNTPPTKAMLRFEVRSESDAMAEQVCSEINEIVEALNAEEQVQAKLTPIARRINGGIGFSHPLVRAARQVMAKLDIEPRIAPSISDLSVLLDHGIPSLTLGITHGESVHDLDETLFVEPINKGICQLIGILQAIDGGICDE